MRRVFLMLYLAALGASGLAAQATGMPLYNAPYRAFQRSEIGGAVSFPSSAGTAFLGMYRMASGKLDLGFQAGIWTPSCTGCKSVFLAGVEARDRVITHNADFPLDGAVVVGVGGEFVSGANVLVIPAGLTLGRRVQLQGTSISMVPYVQPTLFILAGNASGTKFGLGLGADFRFTPRLDGRFSAGLGDVDGVSLGLVWLH
ncbi:MAG TPA: hypothetical protein VF923_01765 [Gemmatimonadales bacterium]